MKVASYGGGRDGSLRIVSDDLSTCRRMAGRATLQAALDEGPAAVEGPEERFDPARCAAPLPRAYQFLDGSAYVNHVDLVRRARVAAMPESLWTDPLMYQGGSDGFLAPREPFRGDPAWGIDFEAEVAVIVGDVALGATRDEAARAIRWVMLCNDWSLRHLIPAELAKGFGFVQSKPACAFSPVAVSPDALPGWDGGRLHGVMRVDLNGVPFGRVETGRDMTFDFPTLIAHAARTRALAAGTIVGSGTVSNRDADGGPGRTVAEGGAGYACIAELRTVETLRDGEPATPYLRPGDRVRIWMEDGTGRSIFGDIEQEVVALRA